MSFDQDVLDFAAALSGTRMFLNTDNARKRAALSNGTPSIGALKVSIQQ